MPDLSKLSPPALKAAMTTGTASWGSYGSARDHALYVEPISPRRKGWRRCYCGCRKRETHVVKANGVALASGCELQAQRSLRDLQKYRNRRTP